MRRRSILAICFLMLAPVFGSAVGTGAAAPPAPTLRYQARADSQPLAGLAEMITFVADFDPGTQTAPHTHPGLTLALLLSGELTFQVNGRPDVTYQAGQMFAEPVGIVGTALNHGKVATSVMVSIVAPKGADPATNQPGGPSPAPPGPTARDLLRADAFFPGDAYEVAQAVFDFAPGAQTPVETHPGQVFVTVFDGAVTFSSQGAERTFQAGESFTELPDVATQIRNTGSGQATLLSTYLLPKGAALSTPTSTPAAGGGGMARRPVNPLVLASGLAVGVGLVLGLGLELRRRRRTVA
jgi:quercetin dioxygenase-like cupin family protein